MKKLKLLLSVCTIVFVTASCKKDSPDPAACNIVCQNGGTITSSCGCNCPAGFTGTNCQTATNPLTSINVSINRDIFYIMQPKRYAGDNEYGGHIHIDGSIQLQLASNNSKIYAVVNAEFLEVSGDTKARIDGNLSPNRILLYTAPAGKKVYSINSTAYNSFLWNPSSSQSGTTGVLFYNNFVYKIEMIGDTSGDDLPSDGTTERSRFKIWFDDFNITIGNQ